MVESLLSYPICARRVEHTIGFRHNSRVIENQTLERRKTVLQYKSKTTKVVRTLWCEIAIESTGIGNRVDTWCRGRT